LKNTLFTFQLFFAITVVFGQKCDVKSSMFISDSIFFKIEIEDKIYEVTDTLLIKYKVENNSDKSIYIFNPKQFYWEPKDFHSILYFGGSWIFQLGYECEPMLIELKGFSNFEYNIILYFNRTDNETNINQLLIENEVFDRNYIFKIFSLNVGFFKDTHKVSVKNVGTEKIVEFGSESDAMKFMIQLKRFVLGPLVVKLKKTG
jgi:hypothetical protein